MDIVQKGHAAYAVLSAAETAGKAAEKCASALRAYLPEEAAARKKAYSGLLLLIRTVNGTIIEKKNLNTEHKRIYGAISTAWFRLNTKPEGGTGKEPRTWVEVRKAEAEAALKTLKEKEGLGVKDVQRLQAAYEIVLNLLK
jgi:hypothetical protein